MTTIRFERDGAVVELADEHVAAADRERAEAGVEYRLADIVADDVEAVRHDLLEAAIEALTARNHHDFIGARRPDGGHLGR